MMKEYHAIAESTTMAREVSNVPATVAVAMVADELKDASCGLRALSEAGCAQTPDPSPQDGGLGSVNAPDGCTTIVAESLLSTASPAFTVSHTPWST